MPSLDLTLYLVTDSPRSDAAADERLLTTVDKAITGGVTCAQYRDKTRDTLGMIATARQLHAMTRSHGVPLLINDRVDVALAVGCEGVHVGQDDMSLADARRLLGPDAIIGVSVSTGREAEEACMGGADYLGIGAVYETRTKKDTKRTMGPEGVRAILECVHKLGFGHLPTVCIGGVDKSNVGDILGERGAAYGKYPVDGVAVVSAIMSAEDPLRAAQELKSRIEMRFLSEGTWKGADEVRRQVDAAATFVRIVHDNNPLSHNMTNLVVQNFSANVALAMGASPIMANYGQEAKDLSKKLGVSLLINMGTVTPEGLENYKTALKWYKAARRPVVFDPVGAGATETRRAAVKTIMANGTFAVIKGNEAEIMTVWGKWGNDNGDDKPPPPPQRGVDGSNALTRDERARLVRRLAAREHCVVVMTGAVDVLSDGDVVVLVANGHALLGAVTGTGCALGTALSAAVALARPQRQHWLEACLGAVLHFSVAAERAAERPDVRGPGTFVPAFLDELYAVRMATAGGDMAWLERAKVEVMAMS